MGRTGRLRAAGQRLREGWIPLAESIAAATLAWLIDTRIVGHTQPFFAPAAAIIVLGAARGQRARRAMEVLLGVAVGVLLADIVAQAIGVRTTWTIVAVIGLTLVTATAVGAGPILTVQAAVSALYVAVVTPPERGGVTTRFLDALVGGGVALVVSQLAVARDPVAPLTREMGQVFADLAGVLEETADALDHHDADAAMSALTHARGIDTAVERLRGAVAAAGEALRLDVRRRRLGAVRAVGAATSQLDYAVRNVRVLARAGVTLTRSPVAAPPDLGEALRLLASAVRDIDELFSSGFEGPDNARDDAPSTRAQRAALAAVRVAGRLLPEGSPLPLLVIVGQVRATVIDLLRGADVDDAEVLGRVDEAIGLPPV